MPSRVGCTGKQIFWGVPGTFVKGTRCSGAFQGCLYREPNVLGRSRNLFYREPVVLGVKRSRNQEFNEQRIS